LRLALEDLSGEASTSGARELVAEVVTMPFRAPGSSDRSGRSR
jgi:hypothetical protein